MSEWRYLIDDEVTAADGLAVDEALMARHGRGGESGTTLRLYTYRGCALVGRYQSLPDEIDEDACAQRGVEIGRRPTGGGAIIMTPGQLGVAVTAPASATDSPREALARYARGVIAGLAELGITAQFRHKNDLEVDGRKIAGLGLYLDPAGAVLFHASVLVDLDVRHMLEVLRIPGAKLSDKAVSRVEERVTTVARELGRPLAARDVRDAFAAGFSRAFEIELVPSELDRGERDQARTLAEDKYRTRAWIDQDSPRRDARGSALLKTPEGLVRIYVAVHGESIKSVLFAGDYNLVPAEIPRLEAALKWCRADELTIAGETTRVF
ncbi:MAG TPA: biotin/lipoate A/B protein ligase family protein, partial [Kofleriaceae bacterium]|nr:biotin/lipoate A/B protein ligase family protein [Kofleriaceae bacterium]